MKKLFQLKTSNFLKLLSVLVIIFMLVVYIFYLKEKADYRSEDLRDNKLKGFVKKVTSNEVLNYNNLELYDYSGDLQMWTSSTLSVQVSFDNSGKKSLILQNHFVCKNPIESLDTDNYDYLFKVKKSELENTVDINIRENSEFDNYDISEEDFLDVRLVNSKGKIVKSYIVDEKYRESQCYEFVYENNTEKTFNCGDSKPTLLIKYENSNTITESTSYYYNDKNYKTEYIYNNGLVVKSKIYDIDNVCWSFTNKKYNSNNDEILISKYNDSKKSKYFGSSFEMFTSKDRDIKISYVYDENDNWIEKTLDYGDDITIINRKIEYYHFLDYLSNLFTIN